LPSDAWNVDCGLPGFPLDVSNGNCPDPATGPDYDFGQGPMLFRSGNREYVGAGEKSGDFLVLDRNTGQKIWDTKVGPGGLTGGLQWGSATDGTRIYVAQDNSASLSAGYWAALDPATGAVLWQSNDPSPGLPGFWGIFGYSIEGPVSVANGVMYGCSLSPAGPNMFALDGATGAVKWSFNSGASCLGGAAIADGTVYWGTGYRAFGPLTTGVNDGAGLYAFTLGGK
jgi:polyvinyl alcohol dehydrogenase (cytochrome)